jgi:predicted transcriptional regulator
MAATPQLTVRMPPEIRTELERIAKETDRSLAYIIIQACREYVEANPAPRSRK